MTTITKTTFTKSGKKFIAEDAEITNRVFEGGFQDADQGETYIVEYAADAIDEDGNKCQIIWQFEDKKGHEIPADEYDWTDEDYMTIEYM